MTKTNAQLEEVIVKLTEAVESLTAEVRTMAQNRAISDGAAIELQSQRETYERQRAEYGKPLSWIATTSGPQVLSDTKGG